MKKGKIHISVTVLRLTCLSGWLCLLPLTARAEILVVPDQYASIQAAVNAASTGDTVHIKHGQYLVTQTIQVNKAIIIEGEGAEGTTVQAGAPLDEPDQGHDIFYVTAAPTIIRHLHIKNAGGHGIHYREISATVTITRNIIESCVNSAVLLNNMYGGYGTANIINNTIVQCGTGVATNDWGTLHLYNNIIVECDYGFFEWNLGTRDCQYNDAYDNAVANWYLRDVGPFTPPPSNISTDPQFVNSATGNFALLETSPCVDAGHPDAIYNDPDGSRNDMGALPITIAPAVDLDLYIDRVEMTQAIQDGTIPMVAHRPTFVRVTVAWNGSHERVVGVDGLLTVIRDWTDPLPGSPFSSVNGPLTAPGVADLVNENDTLNFRFIMPETTRMDLKVELNPPGPRRIPETDYGNNTYVLVDQRPECGSLVRIGYVPIDYQGDQPPGSPANLPDAGMIATGNGERFVRAIYPIGHLAYFAVPQQTWSEDINAEGQAAEYLNDLETARRGMNPTPDLLYAWLRDNPYWGNGAAFVGGRVAFGNTAENRYLRTFAHELGHCLGLWHPGQSTPDGDETLGHVGVDVDNLVQLGRIKPQDMFGIMEPGRLTNQAWVDTASYSFFLEHELLACPPEGINGVLLTDSILLVTGLFDPSTTTASIDALYEFPDGECTVASENGNLILRAYNLDVQEELIHEVQFTAVGVDCTTQDPCVASIAVAIPNMPGDPQLQVDRVDIILAATSEVLAQRWRSEAVPEIAIVNPAVGEDLFDGMEIAWTGLDADGDTIHYSVLYSWDGGQSWTPIAVDTTDTSVIFEASTLPGSDPGEARLKLTATDGLNNVAHEVADLTLDAKKSPQVHILAPNANTIELEGAPVMLQASVYDPEQGELTDETIHWSSDIDGPLGAGTSLIVASLSAGQHVLAVSAVDSDNMSGTDSVMLEIVPRPSGVAPGDFNYDGLVGLSDFAFLARCLGGPGLPAAITCPTDFNTDMDADEDVDLGDVAEFQRIVSVPP